MRLPDKNAASSDSGIFNNRINSFSIAVVEYLDRYSFTEVVEFLTRCSGSSCTHMEVTRRSRILVGFSFGQAVSLCQLDLVAVPGILYRRRLHYGRVKRPDSRFTYLSGE